MYCMIGTGRFIVSIKKGKVKSNFWIYSWGLCFQNIWLIILYKLIKTSVDFMCLNTELEAELDVVLCVWTCFKLRRDCSSLRILCPWPRFSKVVKHHIPLWEERDKRVYLLRFPEDTADGGGSCFGTLQLPCWWVSNRIGTLQLGTVAGECVSTPLLCLRVGESELPG